MNHSSSNQDVARAVYDRLGRAGRWALALGVAAVVLLALWLWPLLWALVLPSSGAASAQADEKQRLAELEQKFSEQIAQFDGRTVFYVPAPPTAEAPPEDEPVDPGLPPPPPDRYGGPAIIGMVNETVWFNDGSRVKVGDSAGDVAVVALDAPWNATILWKQREFTVPFFERDSVVLAKSSSTSAGGLPSPPPPEEANGGSTPGEPSPPPPTTAPAPEPAPDPPGPEPAPPPDPDEPPPFPPDGPPPPPPDGEPRDAGGQSERPDGHRTSHDGFVQHAPADHDANEEAR